MTILLRTLARKSVLDFGKYKDRSVQQVIDLKNFRALRYYYYNCSMISFLPDILEEIGITEEWTIDKPGKDPGKGEALNSVKDMNIATYRKAKYADGDIESLGRIVRQKNLEKKRKYFNYNRFKREDRIDYSKGNLAWINQGH